MKFRKKNGKRLILCILPKEQEFALEMKVSVQCFRKVDGKSKVGFCTVKVFFSMSIGRKASEENTYEESNKGTHTKKKETQRGIYSR